MESKRSVLKDSGAATKVVDRTRLDIKCQEEFVEYQLLYKAAASANQLIMKAEAYGLVLKKLEEAQ